MLLMLLLLFMLSRLSVDDVDGHSRWEVSDSAWLSLTHRRRLLPSFVFFSCRVATKRKTVVIFGTCTSRTLLCSPYTTTQCQKPTARTPAGRHCGDILMECKNQITFRSNQHFLVGWMNRNTDSHGLLFVVPFGRIIVPYTTIDIPHHILYTTYRTSHHIRHHATLTERYETKIVGYRPVLLLSFLSCNSYVCDNPYPLLPNDRCRATGHRSECQLLLLRLVPSFPCVVRLLVCSFARLLVCLFVRLLVRLFACSFVCSFACLFLLSAMLLLFLLVALLLLLL